MTGLDDAAPSIPGQRAAEGGRHAAPRVSARTRLRGRALAMAAVPTALLMGAVYSPTLASAADPAGKACASAPDTASDSVLSETPVPKTDLTPLPGPTMTPAAPATRAPGTQAPTAPATTAPAATAPATKAPATTVPAGKTGSATGGQVIGAAYAVSSAAPVAPPVVAPAGLVGDILDGIGDLLHPSATASPSATPAPGASPSPSAAPASPASGGSGGATAGGKAADPAQPATGAKAVQPSAAAPATTPKAAASPKAVVSPKAAASPSASPTADPTADPNCAVDTRSVAARKASDEHVVPEQNWTLRSSRLALHGAVFNGVYDVHKVSGTKRVLKFTVDSVDIENLDMSTLEGNGLTFHVKGASGSTSTMRKGPVTMYVERLSGHLSKVIGLPIPIDLGEITLTPDTLPGWLWDLIGAVPIPLDLEMTGAEAVQAGQFGGTLKIPGMHLYNDDEPYAN